MSWGAVNSGLVRDAWCAYGGEAMAAGGGGVNMGSECGRWDGGVQDSRSASSTKGFSASESYGSS